MSLDLGYKQFWTGDGDGDYTFMFVLWVAEQVKQVSDHCKTYSQQDFIKLMTWSSLVCDVNDEIDRVLRCLCEHLLLMKICLHDHFFFRYYHKNG